MKTKLAIVVLAALSTAIGAAGCKAAESGGYQAGELGNGGFYFSCDDAVTCAPYSEDADKFPDAVSLSSTFAVRFVPKSGSGVEIRVNESAPDKGITISAVGDFISRGPKGFVALKTGYATLASRDAGGKLIDHTFIRIVKPDALVIYAADTANDKGASPTPVTRVSIGKSERRHYRAFAKAKNENLAGSLALEWTSSNPSVLEIESVSDGKVSVFARTAGTATLTAIGGTFPQQLAVEVTP